MRPPAERQAREPQTRQPLPPLPAGSVPAKTLAEVWGGRRTTLIDSPPGAGKTYIASLLASHLAIRANMRCLVTAGTNSQSADFVRRFWQVAPQAGAILWRSEKSVKPNGIPSTTKAKDLEGRLAVATTSKLVWQRTFADGDFDLLIIDEAYQMTWADMLVVRRLAPQIVMVGDPGQIAPVVAGDMSRWERDPEAPHLPAPKVMGRTDHDMLRLQLPSSRRLGQTTVNIIQPAFYPGLPFVSSRPDRKLIVAGSVAPELELIEVEGPGGEADPMVASAIASRVHELVGSKLHEGEKSRSLTAGDVGVVVAHVSQAGAVQAKLGPSCSGVMVDTAERWQGLERPAMVIWDPLAGGLADFECNTGRACVMLSRHSAHATFVSRVGLGSVLKREAKHNALLRPHLVVREALAGTV